MVFVDFNMELHAAPIAKLGARKMESYRLPFCAVIALWLLTVQVIAAKRQSQLGRVLASYAAYYNQTRTHLAFTERCTLASSSPMVWCHCRYSHLVRAASPIRPDMIFGKDRRSPAVPMIFLWMFGDTPLVRSETLLKLRAALADGAAGG